MLCRPSELGKEPFLMQYTHSIKNKQGSFYNKDHHSQLQTNIFFNLLRDMKWWYNTRDVELMYPTIMITKLLFMKIKNINYYWYFLQLNQPALFFPFQFCCLKNNRKSVNNFVWQLDCSPLLLLLFN